ncbi:MAG: P-II family nitrogen regulator [Alphaproteobacteria bacterium]|jgi:nitrogen regulatory protein PII|nr:P-II family nitrogen regulator [Alphaproteobacteria bacterium]MDP6812058.1 P-II family nitrogen regulator [Alphaproteobacteria bacterium]
MKLKLIMALVDDSVTDTILDAAREAGATGATVITSARGEGLTPEKTFMGLNLAGQRDLVMFLVVEQLARDILEKIAVVGRFNEDPGAGIAFQVGIEDAVGLKSQLNTLLHEIEDEL